MLFFQNNILSFVQSKQKFTFEDILSSKLFLNKRHSILKELQFKLRLPSSQHKANPDCVDVSNTDVSKKISKKYGKISLTLNLSFPDIVYCLPLPQISNEWGVAQLILRLKLPTLINVLILLLLERSVLIIGDKIEEVSACTFALKSLLCPYKWSSIFLPSLSEDMMDFITSPVPFIAGMIGKNIDCLNNIETDSRVKQERMMGLTVINITSGKILWTEEPKVRKNMFTSFKCMM